jgi:hypothetical protein
MATDLQLLYLQARVGRVRHRTALERIARKTGIDPETIARCLHRARRADEQAAKVAKREAQKAAAVAAAQVTA